MDVVGYLGQGILHEERGIPCQDALAYRSPDGDRRLLVLSDGAGSAEYAKEGAWANVQGILGLFGTHTLESVMQLPEAEQHKLLLGACRSSLARAHADFDAMPWEFSATLLFFVLEGSRWMAGHLGDGFLTVLDREGRAIVSSEPENKDESSQTYFTVSSDAAGHLRLYSGTDHAPAQVLMASDGPCAMFRTRHRILQSAADELLGYVRGGEITSEDTLSQVLDQMNFYPFDRRDDWSVLIWSEGADFGSRPEPTVRSMLEREKLKTERES